ncbi:vitelline membrane outer layer protein 1-like [Macrobrachium nipponense]|uniref:vitelline membrane outer layer protein 1-like n=1 Tax=Macrobrachium nipponense TaxID=159736 RepID=UPI0030C87A69
MKAAFLILCFFCLSISGHPVEEPSIPLLNVHVTGNLTLDNGLDYGSWGSDAFCRSGSYVRDIEALFQEYNILHTDETAINAIKLSCMVPGGHHTGEITSTVGERGDWIGLRSCQKGLMTGMRARVLEYQGTLGDDVAVQNVEMECNYNESSVLAVDEDSNIQQGQWSEWGQCDEGSAVCGIKIRYEEPFLIEDTVGVSDIIMYCCSVDAQPTTAPTPTKTSSWPEPSTTAWPEPTTTAWPEPTTTAWPEPTTTAWPEPTTTAWPEPTTTAWPEPTTTAWPEPTTTAWHEPTTTAAPEPTTTAWSEPQKSNKIPRA